MQTGPFTPDMITRLLNRMLLVAVIAMMGHSMAHARGSVDKVEAKISQGKTQVLVSVSNPSSYTVIGLSEREILVAFQDASLQPAAKKPVIEPGTIIKDLSVTQKRLGVVSILALLKEPATALDHSLDKQKNSLVVEISGAKPLATPKAPVVKPTPTVTKPASPAVKPVLPTTKPGEIPTYTGPTIVEGVPTIIRPDMPGGEEAPPEEPEEPPEFTKELVKMPGDPRFPIIQPKDPSIGKHDFKWDAPLLDLGPNGSSPEHQLFARAVESYTAGRWQESIGLLDQLEQMYPGAEPLEKAAFLKARAYHGLYQDALSKRAVEVSQKYRQAAKQYPASPFVAQALTHMAEMYLNIGNYPEAAAYCDLVWDQHKDRAMTPDFMLLRGRALLANGQKAQAMGVFNMLLGYFPDSEFVEPARLEKAKVQHEERAYKQSLATLSDIVDKNPQARYIYPDLARYMAENYYQLEDYTRARALYFESLNFFPQSEGGDLAMTKIGDTYKEQGLHDKSAMIYRRVVNNYPGSDGRLISLVRLADYMEDYPDKKVMEDKTSRDIHQDIVRNNPDHPLAQVSMLKLARLAHREKKYEEAVSILLQLLSRHPFTKLHDDVRDALLASVEAIFIRDHKDKKYAHIVEYYDKVRDVVPFDEIPELMFIVANAYKETGMCSWSLTLVAQAARYYDDPKPAEILFLMAECLKVMGDYEKAKQVFETFVLQYPDDPRHTEAHYLMSEIYLRDEELERAAHSLEVCLQPGTPYAGEFDLMFTYAGILKDLDRAPEAIKAYQEAVELAMGSEPAKTLAAADIYESIGDLYEQQDQHKEAIVHFEKALDLTGEPNSYPALEFKLARCLAISGDIDRATRMLETLAQSGQNVWARAAKAKLEQVLVKGAWDETG